MTFTSEEASDIILLLWLIALGCIYLIGKPRGLPPMRRCVWCEEVVIDWVDVEKCIKNKGFPTQTVFKSSLCIECHEGND